MFCSPDRWSGYKTYKVMTAPCQLQMRDRGVLSSHVLFGREVVLCIWEKGSLQGELIQWIVKRRKLKPIGEQATNTLQVEYFTSFRPLTWKVISSRACCFLISTARR